MRSLLAQNISPASIIFVRLFTPRLEKNKRHSAFTLTELLTVISIMGILAALILSAVSQAKGKAQKMQCGHNIGQVGLALQLFITDYHVYPLFVNDIKTGPYPEHKGAWMAALERGYLATAAKSPSGWLKQGVWHCPAARRPSELPPEFGYGTYSYNVYGMSYTTDTNSLGLGGHFIWNGVGTTWPAPPVHESEVVNPSEMMALGDDFRGGNGVIQDGKLMGRTYGLTNIFGDSTGRAYSRHGGTESIIFCDGHLESPKLKTLFVDTDDNNLARWNRDHLPHREKLGP